MDECIFCQIIAGQAPASRVYEDDRIISFMTLRPTRNGECTVLPKEHIDHFTDIPDDLVSHIMVISQQIGRKMMEVLSPLRIGMVIHGFGLPHAHLILVPQQDPHDIVSSRHAYIEDGKVRFSDKHIEITDRQELDRIAALLSI